MEKNETNWLEYVEKCNEHLKNATIHVQNNEKGGYFIYYMTNGEPDVVEENVQECDLMGRISKLYQYLKTL